MDDTFRMDVLITVELVTLGHLVKQDQIRIVLAPDDDKNNDIQVCINEK